MSDDIEVVKSMQEFLESSAWQLKNELLKRNQFLYKEHGFRLTIGLDQPGMYVFDFGTGRELPPHKFDSWDQAKQYAWSQVRERAKKADGGAKTVSMDL